MNYMNAHEKDTKREFHVHLIASGPPGHSPTIDVEDTETGVKVTVNDIHGQRESDITIPKKISDLENDEMFIKSDEISDWAKAPEKPIYTYDEVGALSADTFIPLKLSDLEEDEDHTTVTKLQKENWYLKPSLGIPKKDLDSSIQKSLNLADNALPKGTFIPSELRDLRSDVDHRTVTDLQIKGWNNKVNAGDVYSKSETNNLISSIPKFKIEVVDDLPEIGDSSTLYLVPSNRADSNMYTEYIYINNAWEVLGSQRIDLTGYATEEWVTGKIAELDVPKMVIDDLSTAENRTWSASHIAQRFGEVEMAKFPNVTIIGQPTIQSGQISNFSATDYCQFPFVVNFQGQPFQIDLEMTTGNDVSMQHNVLDSVFGLAFAVRQSRFVIALSTTGTSWNIGEGIGTHVVTANTTYKVRMTWDGSEFILSYSTDGGETYITDIVKTLIEQPYPKQMLIGVSSDKHANFNGTINLNYASLIIANKLVWTGMDDVGLATRADVSLSNIDELGVAKIVKSASTYVDEKIDSLDIPVIDPEVGVSTNKAYSNTVSVATGVWTTYNSTALPSGSWIITVDLNFTASATGNRRGVRIFDNETKGALVGSTVQIAIPSSSSAVRLQAVGLLSVSGRGKTIAVQAYQDTGSALNVTSGNIKYMRIK